MRALSMGLMMGVVAACGGSEPSGAGPDDSGSEGTTAAVTWHDDVAPIVAERCARCHQEGAASFSLDSYEAAAAWAPIARQKLIGDTRPPYQMPPWFADSDTCEPVAPWMGDESLSDEQLATFLAWIDGGTPEGEPKPFPEVLTEPFTGERLAPAQADAVPASGDDLFLCTPLDPDNAAERWITGLQVNPGAEEVVHHVVVFSDPTRAGADLVGPDGSYPCFGGSGVPGDVLFAWAPGADALRIPADAGIPLPAGGGLILQKHYHPSGEAVDDLTTVDVAWRDDPPAREASMVVFGIESEGEANSPDLVDPPFEVPAGVAGHVEEVRVPIEVPEGIDVRVWSVFSHMHLAGTDIRVELEGADDTCLAHNPTWDFDWQRTYVYDAPFDGLPRAHDGDVLSVRCTYDNTEANPVLMEALEREGLDAPVAFGAGEDTTDEMCVAILGVVYDVAR